ncbi:MAG: amidase [Candidatus Tectomicrobia bacterium]|uniref:Amidase n=1 Tax=Tectimicrobiota bacterium TaxID=2528274 RepID=A0A937W593_UNCTE|nr:amidase [Candidatus Tectomicrobia bacterium]
MTALHTLGVAEVAALVQRREVSPVEVVTACLDRIAALEPTLHAWVTVDRERALAAAHHCEQAIQRGEAVGPLAGVPVGLKDIIYTAGVRTTAGSRVYANFVPTYDATVVVRLRQAGAMILGKTVTTEFATADPSPTRNPWNTAHTPGGSSSGSAAAVGARMLPAALGSQTGGSTLRPAAYCGVVGLKPTYGRISRYGVIPVSWCLDHVGILVRSVQDAALVLEAIAGPDPHDASTLPQAIGAYTQAVQHADTPPRLGVLRDFFRTHADAETQQNLNTTVERLARAGAQVREVTLPPSYTTVLAAHRMIMKVEAAAFHTDMFMSQREQYGARLRETVEMGLVIPSVDYLRAQRLRRLFQEEIPQMFTDVDILVTPSAPAPAPRDLHTTGDARFQSPWSHAGVPTITLPSGLSQAGLPLGFQLIAPAMEEERLFRAARWCEAALDITLTPPL